MSPELLSLNIPPEEEIRLMKDTKLISHVRYVNSPIKLPYLNICRIKAAATFDLLGLSLFYLHPAFKNDHEQKEWMTFTQHLQKHNRVAHVVVEAYELYIHPPDLGTAFIDAIVLYKRRNKVDSVGRFHNYRSEAIVEASIACTTSESLDPMGVATTACTIPSEGTGESLDDSARKRDFKTLNANHTTDRVCEQTSGHIHGFESKKGVTCKPNDCVEKNYVQTNPSYLRTLGQTHSGWVFGAIAELVDNSRDANATKLDILVEFVKKDGKEIPMLSVIDDGDGMSHQEIVRMLSFGCKAADVNDPAHIGHFGIGFKTGSMKIGRDAIVLTQTAKSRSIGFLSQSLNEGKDILEIPIVSYVRQGLTMEFDLSVHTPASAKYNLRIIKEFSPFDEYFIATLFTLRGVGTQIYMWNLDEWGPDYCLDWQDGKDTLPEGDIFIRSRRIRMRPGQISQKVPLDYSLRSYLEVIFLDPRLKIKVQGSLVKSRPLAKSLNKTAIRKCHILGKPVQLILGRSQVEWERMNSGIFLYWHGRLIEAYKRVGGMIHNADMGRGVIGVVDVTELMNGEKHVLVHNNKQGFQDCEVYAELEEWLGHQTDKYWDDNFDSLEVKKSNARYIPDHEWVQCDKCRKWRILSSGYDSKDLPPKWFCCMPPFSGQCKTPEQQLHRGVITVAAKRSGCDFNQKHDLSEEVRREGTTEQALNDDSDCSIQTQDKDFGPACKRMRRGSSKND